MKKIVQGKYEIFTTKEDAIDKFLQLQGVCRETLISENSVEFYCTKKGEIVITNSPTRTVTGENSTNLYGRVVEENDKTYVTYYTSFSKLNQILKILLITMNIMAGILATILDRTYSPAISLFCLVFFVAQLFVYSKENNNAVKDSETLINVLEERVNAVNRWDG